MPMKNERFYIYTDTTGTIEKPNYPVGNSDNYIMVNISSPDKAGLVEKAKKAIKKQKHKNK